MAIRQKRWNGPFWLVLFAAFALLTAYVVGTSLWLANQGYGHARYLMVSRMVDASVAVWIFSFGASIGSFLNVVAYRMPRQRSLSGGSSCPFCCTPISARDNIPVLGWFALRGRCRTCRLPISARYPAIEFAVGISVTLIGFLGAYCGNSNLPYYTTVYSANFFSSVGNFSNESIGIGIYHAIALSATWALGLVRFDGVRLPRSLVTFALAFTVIPILIWPPLQIVPWQVRVDLTWQPHDYLSGLMRVVTGLVAATAIGRLVGRSIVPEADVKLHPLSPASRSLLDLIAIFSVPAVVLGWQAFMGIALVTILVAVMLRRWFPDRDGLGHLGIVIPFVLAIQIAFWRTLDAQPYWPGTHCGPWVIIGYLFGIMVLSRWLTPSDSQKFQTTPDANH